jgi:hypothetical protein
MPRNDPSSGLVEDKVGYRSAADALRGAAHREIVFIDPAISDLDAFLSGVRPGIDYIIILGRYADATAQIAEALRGLGDFDAVHVVAHGTPGEVSFGSGALTLATIADHASDLATIGDALKHRGALLLWTCKTGAGEEGRAFVEALANATGAKVAAAPGLIGASAKGGAWNLSTQAGSVIPFPPLSARGIATYAGLMLKILPGMPVEAFVQTGTRSAFSHFLKPLTDQVMRTFRES